MNTEPVFPRWIFTLMAMAIRIIGIIAVIAALVKWFPVDLIPQIALAVAVAVDIVGPALIAVTTIVVAIGTMWLVTSFITRL